MAGFAVAHRLYFSYKDFKDDFKTANKAGISTPGVG